LTVLSVDELLVYDLFLLVLNSSKIPPSILAFINFLVFYRFILYYCWNSDKWFARFFNAIDTTMAPELSLVNRILAAAEAFFAGMYLLTVPTAFFGENRIRASFCLLDLFDAEWIICLAAFHVALCCGRASIRIRRARLRM
jgi:hypothetical protein